MRDKPYLGMGNVDKAEGLYLKEKRKEERIAISIPGGFAQIPIPFLIKDSTVIANDILVYNALSAFANNITKIGYPLLRTISKVARRNERLVMETIKHLVEIGWTTKIRRGQGKSNIYKLHFYKGQKFTRKELKNTKKAINDEIAKFYR